MRLDCFSSVFDSPFLEPDAVSLLALDAVSLLALLEMALLEMALLALSLLETTSQVRSGREPANLADTTTSVPRSTSTSPGSTEIPFWDLLSPIRSVPDEDEFDK